MLNLHFSYQKMFYIDTFSYEKCYCDNTFWHLRVNRELGLYPLSLYEDLPSFKAYYCDIGLLSMRMALTPKSILNPISVSPKAKGLLAESYVAEELSSKGYKLRYWTSGNLAKVDFVIQIEEDVIPLEVKSADNVKSKSLSIYVKNYSPAYSFRISSKNFGYENGIKSIPLYALFCLPKAEPAE